MSKVRQLSNEPIAFKDTDGNKVKDPNRRIETKEADGKKRKGAHETPASADSLQKLAARFSKQ